MRTVSQKYMIFLLMLTVFGFSGFVAAIAQDEHTVAIWLFEEGKDKVIKDISGNGNDGELKGPKWDKGKFGGGLKFGGGSDFVEVPDSENLDLTDGLTIEMWLYLNAYSTAGGNGVTKETAYKVGTRSDKKVMIRMTTAGGQGWLLYRFDISMAKGKAGDWRFIGRIINPNNHSDWLWVLGDDGNKIPEVAPAFVRPDDIIFENNTPTWTWVRDGDFGADGGTINKLQDGENVMMIWYRGSSLEDQYDVFMWADDLEYIPTDDHYINAEQAKLPVMSKECLAISWGQLKAQ